MSDDPASDQEVPSCPGPNPSPSTPAHAAPPDSCDCHFHIFGPYDRYPLSPSRSYTPPEASVSAYRHVMTTLGVERYVIVQPSVYGTDHACMLDAMQQLGPASGRAVAVIDTSFDARSLEALHAAGVRGARLNAVHGGPSVAEALDGVARLIAPFGWHLQLYLPRQQVEEIAPSLPRLPVPVVLDHLGRLDPAAGLDDSFFVAMLRLLETGRCWVKLSGYLSSALPAPYPDVEPFVRALARVRPDRLVWGTNWPHPVRYRDMPDDGALLDALAGWLDDERVRIAVLRDNPARLYGFS